MTEPGCAETVDWVVMNRPVYITAKQVIYVFSIKNIGSFEQNSKGINERLNRDNILDIAPSTFCRNATNKILFGSCSVLFFLFVRRFQEAQLSQRGQRPRHEALFVPEDDLKTEFPTLNYLRKKSNFKFKITGSFTVGEV